MSHSDCPAEFSGPVRAGIIASLREAYDEADLVYAPERGRGDHLHALAVYHVACFNLAREMDGVSGVSMESRGRGPELRIGPYRVRWNKVGRGDGDETIRTSFPRGSRAVTMMAEENQLRLFEDSELDPLGHPMNWIVAHLGNPRDGLIAIYLASPVAADGERVTGWRDIIPIWSASQPDIEFPSAPRPGLPEPVEIGELPVVLIDDSAAGEEA